MKNIDAEGMFDRHVKWYAFSEQGLEKVAHLNNINTCGVYVIRSKSRLKRVRGESDVVYIGTNKKDRTDGLYGRLKSHINNRSSASKYLTKLKKIASLEFAWILKQNADNRTRWEAKQLQEYLSAHMELPPANCSLPHERE